MSVQGAQESEPQRHHVSEPRVKFRGMGDALLLTTEAIGTREWRLLYAVYVEAFRSQEALPPKVAAAVVALVKFYASHGRDHAGVKVDG